jgi:phage gp36-like protein
MSKQDDDDGGVIEMDESPDTAEADELSALWPTGPAPCPEWELVASGRGVKAHSWTSPEQAKGTYVVPEQAIVDLQHNKKIVARKEDGVCVLTLVPCIVEQSPAIAACAGSAKQFARYTSSIASVLLLNDLRLLFGVVLHNEYVLAGDKQRADAMVEQMRAFRRAHGQWERALAQTVLTDVSKAMLEHFTLRYIHLLERCVMQMLWIESKRDPAQVLELLPRFLTRAMVFPPTVFASTKLPVLERHCLDAARFFAQKQAIIYASCDSASDAQTRSFFPTEHVLSQRTRTDDLFAPETLLEYQRYLQSPFAFKNVTGTQ